MGLREVTSWLTRGVCGAHFGLDSSAVHAKASRFRPVRALLCDLHLPRNMRTQPSHLAQQLRALGFEIHRGQPLVLAFTDHVELRDSAVLERVRAELRGLGAALFLVWEGHVFAFRPDDEVDQVGSLRQVESSTLAALRHACGVRSSASALSIVIVGGDGDLLARHVIAEQNGLEALAEGLAVAGRKSLETRFSPQFSRREVVLASLVGAFALLALEGCHHHHSAPPPVEATQGASKRTRKITLNVNGVAHEIEIEPRVSLLDALRERLGLTGTKKGCDAGQCGACTVLVAGRRVNACLTLAVMVGDAPITTIEGLAQGDTLHPMQAAFVEEDALQCGYCTPGQIVSALGLVRENRAHTEDEVREHMSGNICRCGAYTNIVAAIQRARAASLG